MNLSLLTIIWSMLAAMSLSLGLMHVVLWARRHYRTAFILAAIMATASGVSALLELAAMKTADATEFGAIVRIQNVVIAVLLVAMVWYVLNHLQAGRRWLAVTISALWTAGLVFNFLSPSSLTYLSVDELVVRATSWGESFALAVGTVNPAKFMADLASLLILVFVVDASVTAWRRGRRHRAVVVGGSITFFILAAGLHTPLVDAGLVQTPPMISVTFFAIVMALTWEIARDAARSAEYRRELVRTREEMDRLTRAGLLGEFASAIAHELNQPLTAVLANAQVARRYLAGDPPRVADAHEMLDLIVRDDKRAAAVIQRLRGLMARGEVVREEVDLNGVVRETVELCAREAGDRGIDIRLELEPALPVVGGGRIELQQVVLNLLHNALQALAPMAPGQRKVVLATTTASDGVRFAIEDTGEGVPVELRPTLFEPFQGDREGGIGMGLAICRRIVEAHGGTIRAEEVARGGGRFVVDLPRMSVAGGDVR